MFRYHDVYRCSVLHIHLYQSRKRTLPSSYQLYAYFIVIGTLLRLFSGTVFHHEGYTVYVAIMLYTTFRLVSIGIGSHDVVGLDITLEGITR